MVYNGVLDTVNPLNGTSGVPNTNSWNLDALGNWTGGSQNRTFNAQNQITAMTGFTTPTYDNNGNMKKDEAGNTYQYDAWNRLTLANASGATQVETYSYDGATATCLAAARSCKIGGGSYPTAQNMGR